MTTSPAQAPAPPAPVIAARDAVRPTARLSKLSCTKKRRCTFRVRASDNGGRVAKLSTQVSRRARTCKRTRSGAHKCRTTMATDAAGNHSKKLTRTFRVW